VDIRFSVVVFRLRPAAWPDHNANASGLSCSSEAFFIGAVIVFMVGKSGKSLTFSIELAYSLTIVRQSSLKGA